MLVLVLGAVALKYKVAVSYTFASNFMLLSCSKIAKACLLNWINIPGEYEVEVVVRFQMAHSLIGSIYF